MDERATTNDHHSSPVRRLARRHPIAMFLVIALSRIQAGKAEQHQ